MLPSSLNRRRVFVLTIPTTKWGCKCSRSTTCTTCTNTMSLARCLFGATYHHVHLHTSPQFSQHLFYIAQCTRVHKIYHVNEAHSFRRACQFQAHIFQCYSNDVDTRPVYINTYMQNIMWSPYAQNRIRPNSLLKISDIRIILFIAQIRPILRDIQDKSSKLINTAVIGIPAIETNPAS